MQHRLQKQNISTLFYIIFLILHLNDAICVENVNEFDPSWIKMNKTDPENPINLLFALKQQNVNVLINKLMEVSDPKNSNYGKYLSRIEVNKMVKPSYITYNTIKQWLLSFDIHPTNIINKTNNGDFLQVTTTIQIAEKLLNCDYYDYYNELISDYIISRMDTNCNYNIPSIIAQHLDFISPTKRFPSIQHIKYRYSQPIHSNDHITQPQVYAEPIYLSQLYQINNTNNSVGKSPKNKQGIASFLDQYFNDTDIINFWDTYNITSSISNIHRKSNNNKSQPQGYGSEATLNVQYMTSIGQNITTEVWYTQNMNTSNNIVTYEPFLTFLLDIINTNDSYSLPWLFIIGYYEYEFNLGYSYCSRCNTEIAKIGTMGISLLVMSGNSGTGSDTQCCSRTPLTFCPTFPASSPYITSVGDTQGGTIGDEPTGETAFHPSGGGFSNFFERPQYQNKSVIDFINLSNSMNQLPNESLFNISGRGFPDISGCALNYNVLINNIWNMPSGTDCSLGTVGGIISLLNDIRFQNNMSSLGWLNPLIYQIVLIDELSFNDITCDCANNACIGPDGFQSFHAIKGWDAVTGWGTPNFSRLKKYITNISYFH
eukprot:208694_1